MLDMNLGETLSRGNHGVGPSSDVERKGAGQKGAIKKAAKK